MKLVITITITLILTVAGTVYADEQALVKGFDMKCEMSEMDSLAKATHFKALQDKAKRFALKTCENMIVNPTGSINDVNILLDGTDKLVDAEGNTFSFKAVLYEEWKKSFEFETFEGMAQLAYDFSYHQPSQVTSMDDFKGLEVRTSDECADLAPTCEVILEYRSSRAEVTFKFYQDTPTSNKQREACKEIDFDACEDALLDLKHAIEPYRFFIKLGHTTKVVETLHQLNDQWDDFTKKSRHQTFIDKWLTTEVYHKQFNGKDWAAPPELQYFLFHPSLVVDNFTKAQKGDQVDLGLAVEWYGFNNWNGKIPLGASVTTVFTDRSSGKQSGTGLMIHLYNDYSFGAVNRGNNEYSFFINIESFDWFNQKQDQYKKYKEKFKGFR